jgi:RHS repeat-associated protein
VASITLPTGGTTTYTYNNGNAGSAASQGIVCADGSTAGLIRQTPDGTWTYARSQVSGSHWQTKITSPVGDDTVIDFQQNSLSHNFYETQRVAYQGSSGSGSVLRTINNCFNGAASPCTTVAIVLPMTQHSITTQLGAPGTGAPISKTLFTYNNFGLVTEEDNYDWGFSGGPGPLLKKTLVTFANLGSNLNGFQQTVVVQDGNGVIKSRRDTNYDQTTPTCVTGAPQHDDTSHGCSFNVRANATSVTTYTNPSGPSGPITHTFTYDTLGNVRTVKDALNNTTTFSYSPDAWVNTACPPPPTTTTYAFPVKVTNALSQSSTFTYFACSGQLASITDRNTQTTSFAYDSLLRPTTTNLPDGGQTTATYSSQTSITTTTKMNSAQNIVSTATLDGLGRVIRTQLNDPQGNDFTDTTYDSLGRVVSVSNRYRSTSDPTYGITRYVYDALSRICVIVPPDGTAVSGNTCPASQPTNDIFAAYSGNTTTVTDQAGKRRSRTIDGLGRLSQITEAPGGLGYVTTYTYDALNNLTGVAQNGSTHNRTFSYDALSQLTSETNPESGTTNYYYTTSGSALCSGVATQLCRRTDARNITTTLSYDSLNRLTSKSYSDGTPSLFFSYDIAPTWMSDLTNVVGRLVEANNQFAGVSGSSAAAAVNSYDAMGRIVRQWQQTPSTSPGGNFVYQSYDFAGNPTSSTNAAGVTISYAYDAAGRPNAVTSSWSDAQHPATLATVDSAVGYYPHGAIRKMTFANSLTQTAAFNNTLEPCRINVNSTGTTLGTCGDAVPSGNLQDFGYDFSSNSANNGNLVSWAGAGREIFNRSYTYDALNRLSTLASPSDTSGCTGLSWTYDPWGNRTDQNVTSGTCTASHATVNTNNQLIDPINNKYLYDAAGNMVRDNFHTYTYDAENHLTAVDAGATGTYVYGAGGQRVRKNSGGSWTEYFYDLEGNVTAESIPSAWLTQYVYLNGGLIAQYSNNTTYSIFKDHLGSTRVIYGLDRGVVGAYDFLPFGQQILGGSPSSHKFTGDERDAESNLDHTQFRQYTLTLGRWMHPDPAGLAAVAPTNPQSWNRYLYALNSPANLIDPSGLNPRHRPRVPPRQGIDCINFQTSMLGSGPGTCTGTDCTVDGFAAPCGMVLGLLQSGAAAVCPQNDCNGVKLHNDNIFYRDVYTQTSTEPVSTENECSPPFVQGTCGGDISYSVEGGWRSIPVGTTGGPNLFWTLMDAYWNGTPWTGSIGIESGSIAHVGASIPISYIPKTNTVCVGLGPAAGVSPPGEAFTANGGPVLALTGDAEDVLSGASLSYTFQPHPLVGWSNSINNFGSAGSYSIGSWGGNVAGSYSGCWALQK